MLKGYAVLLNPTSPREVLELLEDYVHSPPGREHMKVVFCETVEHHGAFVELGMIRVERKSPWMVLIPVSCVYAIADSSGSKDEIGFLRSLE